MDREEIKDLFGSDMAQRDPRFLDYCIFREKHLKTLGSRIENLVILNAPRGSGKSGLFIQLHKRVANNSKENLVIAKNSGNVEYPSEEIELTDCINFWKNQLLGWIFSEIGKNTKFAFTEAEINAVEFSEAEGSKGKNIVSLILERIKFKGSPIEKCKTDPIVREEEIIRLLANNPATYWLLLDELDDNYDNSTRVNNIIAGLLLASQAITDVLENVKVRLTIRPHVMRVLETRYDKIPTLRENQFSVSWSSLELRKLLARRIDSYLQRNSIPFSEGEIFYSGDEEEEKNRENALISKYFDNFDISFEDGGSTKKIWVYQTLATISMYRPRWLIEYCKICLENSENERVTTKSAQIALFYFGKNRISFLEAEHSPIFKNVSKILNQFSANRKTNLGDSNQLKEFIKREVIHTGIVPCSEEGIEVKALDIAQFLHMVDFIQAKETLSRGTYKHHYFIDRPQLLSSWNTNTGFRWIIHPSFSNALDLDENRTYRAGDDIKIAKKKYQPPAGNAPRNGNGRKRRRRR
ncbi:P-loop ATPase, Sll1717 family [Ectothiorhodospira shaposhnikovii]|uniref:P-loop ATPase, Sll1717 family n=1 Tax=Ectothiorhodospira shaposhnikovii TaxID=1054 RepID=UPI00190506E7|nr:hypothetical protein [Ectothiorhodospira shaposhnikovii]